MIVKLCFSWYWWIYFASSTNVNFMTCSISHFDGLNSPRRQFFPNSTIIRIPIALFWSLQPSECLEIFPRVSKQAAASRGCCDLRCLSSFPIWLLIFLHCAQKERISREEKIFYDLITLLHPLNYTRPKMFLVKSRLRNPERLYSQVLYNGR